MKKKILVIEDNYEVRDNLCEILELTGYEVVSAENGVVGVRHAMSESPDLILCDVMMPELDGYGVLKILNSNPKLMDIPFMFLTAKAEKTDFRRGMSLGADDYITKPFDDVDLLEAIESRLKKSQRIKTLFDGTESGLQKFIDEAKANRDLETLAINRETRKYNKKDIVYQAGQFPKWMFFVISGQVKASKIDEFGKEFITNIYKEGDFFGFLPMLYDGVYDDNCTTLEASELRMIPSEEFRKLLFNNRDVAAIFIKMLASKVDQNETQLLDLAYSSVRKRVANSLIVLHEKNGPVISMLREDVAALTGTAKETLIRTLSDFKAEKIIEIEGSNITIKDLQLLKSMPQ
ncbi:MAG TPA: response regulator [Saprospiraceae bacterium]|nr:response regulator [Saprospiraceae bacterium]